MNHNPYRKTTMPDMLDHLQARFGDERGALLFESACKKLKAERSKIDAASNRAVIKHLSMGILPCIACYFALLDGGIDGEQALDFVRSLVFGNTRKIGALMKRLCGWMPPALFRRAVKFMVASGYPAAGWDVEWVGEASGEIAFRMRRCLYLATFEQRDCKALCAIYCEADHIMFEGLAPRIRFSRMSTLERGARCCDFCFRYDGHTK